MTRKKLSPKQRRVINNDDIAWVGWDAKNRPVVAAWYFGERLESADPEKRHPHAVHCEYSILWSGEWALVTQPVEKREG